MKATEIETKKENGKREYLMYSNKTNQWLNGGQEGLE